MALRIKAEHLALTGGVNPRHGIAQRIMVVVGLTTGAIDVSQLLTRQVIIALLPMPKNLLSCIPMKRHHNYWKLGEYLIPLMLTISLLVRVREDFLLGKRIKL